MESEILKTFVAGFDKGFLAGFFSGGLVVAFLSLLINYSKR